MCVNMCGVCVCMCVWVCVCVCLCLCSAREILANIVSIQKIYLTSEYAESGTAHNCHFRHVKRFSYDVKTVERNAEIGLIEVKKTMR